MVTTVKLEGTGAENDPYRVNLPDYTMILVNYDAHTALVQIPDASHGLTQDELANEGGQKTSHGLLVNELSDESIQKMHDHMDQRYQEHAGKFRVVRG